MITDKGLAQIAHAVRRSTALYVAAITLPESSSDETLLARADKLAAWVLGKAGVQEETPGQPLGMSFDEARGFDS